jgi:hypothetical protein
MTEVIDAYGLRGRTLVETERIETDGDAKS